MSNPYDDIINLPHHVSSRHKPMPISHRAAQFAPFAALKGHGESADVKNGKTATHPEQGQNGRITTDFTKL